MSTQEPSGSLPRTGDVGRDDLVSAAGLDLSAVQETDALLDRLGSRATRPEDAADPVVAGLLDLLRHVDSDGPPRLVVSAGDRLSEVLAGRPVYQLRPESELSGSPARQAIRHRTATPVRSGRPPVARVTRLPGLTSWPRRLAAPAAAAAVAVVLGSGMSAAVTGDPMAPVTGIARIAARIPGFDDSRAREQRVRDQVQTAASLVQQGQPEAAATALRTAQDALPQAPAESQPVLKQEISSVQEKVAEALAGAGTIPAPADSVAPTPSAVPTASVTPSPVLSPSATAEPVVPVDPTPGGTASPAPTETPTATPTETVPPAGSGAGDLDPASVGGATG